MGIGPIEAIPKVLKRAGLKLEDIDLIELNEAFASQSLAVIRTLGLDPERVNVNGGAIALGHPLGATGAKLTVQAMYEGRRRKARYVMVTMCIGGGHGCGRHLRGPALESPCGEAASGTSRATDEEARMPDELTPEVLFSRMPKAFLPEKAVGLDAVIQFDLSGDQGGPVGGDHQGWRVRREKGAVDNPKLTLIADAVDYVGIFTGKVNPMAAFGEGKIKLKGDIGLAMKLMNIFKMS